MYLYIILIFIVGWIIHPKARKLYSKKIADIGFLLLLFPVCVFAMGLRDSSVGLDTWVYENYFYHYAVLSWNDIIKEQNSADSYEIGLNLLMKLCACIYANYYFYQVIFSTIYIGLFLNFIYKCTSNVVLGCAIFLGGGLFMQPFNIARQMFAVAIIAYSMIYLLKKKYIKSLFLLGIACLFHISSALALCMYLIYFIRYNKLLISISPIFMIVALAYVEQFMIPFLLNTFGADSDYVGYAINDYSRPNKGMILRIMWIINLALALLSLWHYRNGNLSFLAILTLVAFACYWIGLSVNFADRVGLMFLPAILLMYDRIGSSKGHRKLKILYANGCTLFYIIYFFYYISTIKSINYESIIK